MSHPEAAPVPISPPSAECVVTAAVAAKAASAETKSVVAHRRMKPSQICPVSGGPHAPFE
jgi:hypothetical protein